MLVDLAGGDVVVTVERHVQEPVVVDVVRLIQVCCPMSHQTLVTFAKLSFLDKSIYWYMAIICYL